jgi:hypothetical protein
LQNGAHKPRAQVAPACSSSRILFTYSEGTSAPPAWDVEFFSCSLREDVTFFGLFCGSAFQSGFFGLLAGDGIDFIQLIAVHPRARCLFSQFLAEFLYLFSILLSFHTGLLKPSFRPHVSGICAPFFVLFAY